MKKILILVALLGGASVGFSQGTVIGWSADNTSCDYTITINGGATNFTATGGIGDNYFSSNTVNALSVKNNTSNEVIDFTFPSLPVSLDAFSDPTMPAACSSTGAWFVHLDYVSSDVLQLYIADQ